MLVGGVAVLAVMLFIFAVRRHQHALAQREMADRLLLTVDEALQRLSLIHISEPTRPY